MRHTHVADHDLTPDPWPDGFDVEGCAVRGAVLWSSPDGARLRGIWECEPGTFSGYVADEMFTVVSGRATITFADGETIEVAAGDAVVLEAGVPTTWVVHETIRKTYDWMAS